MKKSILYRYSDDPVEYIINALSPARIVAVNITEHSDTHRSAIVVVPDDQLSLAIGKEGQNVRLAHRLTGWRIDIKSLSQVDIDQNDQEYDEEYDENIDNQENTEYQGQQEEEV